MKRYFAGQSAHGSLTSHGFANDWTIYVFSSKSARDEFVENSQNISCVAVPFAKVTKHAANYSMTDNRLIAPRPFTTEFWGIVENYMVDEDIPGCIGIVDICDEDGHPCANIIGRLYN